MVREMKGAGLQDEDGMKLRIRIFRKGSEEARARVAIDEVGFVEMPETWDSSKWRGSCISCTSGMERSKGVKLKHCRRWNIT